MLNAISFLFEREEIPPDSHPQYHALLPGLLRRRGRTGEERHVLHGHDVFEQLAGSATAESRICPSPAATSAAPASPSVPIVRWRMLCAKVAWQWCGCILTWLTMCLLTGVEEDGVRMFDPYYAGRAVPEREGGGHVGASDRLQPHRPLRLFQSERATSCTPWANGRGGRRCCCSTSAPS